MQVHVTHRGFGDSPSPGLALCSTLLALAQTLPVGSWGQPMSQGCGSSIRQGIAFGGRGVHLHTELSPCICCNFLQASHY